MKKRSLWRSGRCHQEINQVAKKEKQTKEKPAKDAPFVVLAIGAQVRLRRHSPAALNCCRCMLFTWQLILPSV